MAIRTITALVPTIAAGAVIALLLLLQACAKYDEQSGSLLMSLDSGVDKKTTRVDSQSYGGYDSEMQHFGNHASSGEAATTPGAASYAPQDGGATSQSGRGGYTPVVKRLSVRAQVQGTDDARLMSWILPQAYAQDHNINERYLIRTGACALEVDDYRAASQKVNAIADKYGGLVSGVQSQRSGEDWLQGTLTIRVPNPSFFNAWTDILALGKVMEESIQTEDASQSYISTLSRMKNLLAEEAAVKEMYKEALAIQRTRGLGEGYKLLTETQERLFAISGQIQETEDQLNSLADRITRSTITVNLYERKEIEQQVQEEFHWGLGTTMSSAYRDLLINVRGKLQGLLYFLVTCWTWLLPLAFFTYVTVWLYRHFLAGRKLNLAFAGAPVPPAAGSPAPPTQRRQPRSSSVRRVQLTNAKSLISSKMRLSKRRRMIPRSSKLGTSAAAPRSRRRARWKIAGCNSRKVLTSRPR